MFQSVPKTASATLVYNVSGGPDIDNTLYFRDVSVPWDAAGLADLISDVHGWWAAEVKPLQVAACVLASIKARDLESEFPFTAEVAYAEAGTRAGTPAPASVAAIVNLKGTPGAPPRSGRVFHVGVAEADIDANLLTAGYVGDVQTAYEGASSMGGAPISRAHVIVSRYAGTELAPGPNGQTLRKPVKRDPDGVTNTVATVVVPQRYGVQKRRRPSPF